KVSSFSLSEEEKKLEGMLSSMEGVGRVKVALTIKSGSESVYALDQSESLRNAGTSDNAAYEKDSDSKPMVVSSDAGGESPVTVKEYLPEYRGALIICDGAADEKIKLEITEAVCALTGITYDNISVIKMKS
ncbi:MAG: hypothetical protein Q8878_06295, partial [Bacillota bacterium]|nr:hypothetical protein [Bacillota bacterium]